MLWLPAMSDAPSWLTRLADGSLDEAVEVQAGTLVVSEGLIVACDPLIYLEDSDAFGRKVPKGERTVSIGRVEGEIAYAKLELGHDPVERWEVATVPDEEEFDGLPGFSIDSGVGAFVDQGALDAFAAAEGKITKKIEAALKKEKLDPESADYAARFDELRADAGPDPVAELDLALRKKDHASVLIAPKIGGNVVAFKSGGGNGAFASFWGLNDKGEPQCLVTDLGVIEESDGLDELEGLDDDGMEDLEAELSDLGGLEALAAALGMGGGTPEPETRQGPSPLFIQARDLLKRWVKEEKIELEPEINLDDFAESFLYKLSSISGHRNPGALIGEWLVDRKEVADVFATDDELEADLRG